MDYRINLMGAGEGIGMPVNEPPGIAFAPERMSDSQFQGAGLAGLREAHIPLLQGDSDG
jgi:hypothetical protein